MTNSKEWIYRRCDKITMNCLKTEIKKKGYSRQNEEACEGN